MTFISRFIQKKKNPQKVAKKALSYITTKLNKISPEMTISINRKIQKQTGSYTNDRNKHDSHKME